MPNQEGVYWVSTVNKLCSFACQLNDIPSIIYELLRNAEFLVKDVAGWNNTEALRYGPGIATITKNMQSLKSYSMFTES